LSYTPQGVVERQLLVIRLADRTISGLNISEPDGLIQTMGLRP